MARGRAYWKRKQLGRNNKKKANNRKKKAKAAPSLEDRPTSGSEDDHSRRDRSHKRAKWQHSAESVPSEEDETSEEEEELVALDEICLSMACYRGRLGAAYYHPQKGTLYMLEDTTESSHFDVAAMLIEQASPRLVITGSTSDVNFIDKMREIIDSSCITFQIRPKREFKSSKGYEQLLTLRLFTAPSNDDAQGDPCSDTNGYDSHGVNTSDESRSAYDSLKRRQAAQADPALQRWNALIRMGNFLTVDPSSICIGATGALLDHLSRVKAIGELRGENIPGLDIRGIEAITLNEFMHINMDALSSLKVFEDENHASIYSTKTKEGLSLFGILNVTRTTIGRKLMRAWFLRPSASLAVIEARHDALSCFLRPDNLTTASTLHVHLKGIGNAALTFNQIKQGKAKVRQWQTVVKFVFHASLLKDSLLELHHGSSVDVVRRLIDCIDTELLRDIGNMVNEIVDWEESLNAGRVCVRPDIDEELDEWKRTLHGLDSLLSRVAVQIGETLPIDFADSLNVVYFPQLGFLICVPLKEEWNVDGEIRVPEPSDGGLVFQFYTENSVYFKSEKMHDLDQHIGDLHPAIVDREIEIINGLEERIMIHDGMVNVVCDVCAELDCLLSFSEASREYNYVRPVMTEDNVIDIKGGRHPLQERVVDIFVPNDTLIAGGNGIISETESDLIESDLNESAGERQKIRSVVVCTGANACGKSVYLKQTALVVYMAQIGCFVPADSSTLGIVDKIFTRLQTKESVSKVQSAFMIDLNQVSFALRNMTARSLLILDEFGKGTLSSDGAALFCATLTYCLSLGASCPKLLTATHFHEIFHKELLDPSLPISYLHMEILLTTENGLNALNPEAEDDGDTEGELMARPAESITYLYRVAEGLCLQSYATKCALAVGMPARIVRRAEHVTKLISSFAITQLLDEDMTPEEEKELEEAEAVCRRFLAWDLDAHDPEVEDVRTKLREVLGILSDRD